MLKCNGKTFMNLQEAVQWLLNNNALFFMCNEDYAADTEISLSEIVNPSPANPKIGSLVLFADGKISPITGITDDSFTVGSDYTDIRFVKSVDHFSIDASQHLIVTYTDGTTEDLGAIFSGDINIDGQLTATTAKIFESIVDKDGHQRFIEGGIDLNEAAGVTKTYGRWSLSGTHLMLVLVLNLANGTTLTNGDIIATAYIPAWLHSKIQILWSTSAVDRKAFVSWSDTWNTQQVNVIITKESANRIRFINGANLTLTEDRNVRIQFDLLIDDQ